jgi:hypothetical protein
LSLIERYTADVKNADHDTQVLIAQQALSALRLLIACYVRWVALVLTMIPGTCSDAIKKETALRCLRHGPGERGSRNLVRRGMCAGESRPPSFSVESPFWAINKEKHLRPALKKILETSCTGSRLPSPTFSMTTNGDKRFVGHSLNCPIESPWIDFPTSATG